MKKKKSETQKKKDTPEIPDPSSEDPLFKILSLKNGAIFLKVSAKPNSKAEGLAVEEEELSVAVTAEPKEGEANKAIIKLLSQEFGVPKSSICVDKGDTSKSKVLRFVVAQPEVTFGQMLKVLRLLKQIK